MSAEAPSERGQADGGGGSLGGTPSFLGLGAQRAGSSWLDALLRTHPDVYLPSRRKELHYFDVHYDRGPGWYSSFFPRGPEAAAYRAIGEITPRYLHDEAAVERIARDLPDARFLCMLRDPVDRAYSQFALTCRDDAYSGGFDEFLVDRPDALARGLYAKQLQRFLQYFPKDRFCCLVFERAIRDVAGTRTALCGFLQLRQEGFAQLAAGPVNAGRTVRFRRAYSLAQGAGRWLRAHDLDGPVNLLKRAGVRRWFGRGDRLPPLADETRALLWDGFREDVSILSATFDLDLSCWGAE